MPQDQCPFAPRCERAEDICFKQFPPFVQLNAEHFSLCHFAEEVYAKSRAEREAKAGAAAPPVPEGIKGPANAGEEDPLDLS